MRYFKDRGISDIQIQLSPVSTLLRASGLRIVSSLNIPHQVCLGMGIFAFSRKKHFVTAQTLPIATIVSLSNKLRVLHFKIKAS